MKKLFANGLKQLLTVILMLCCHAVFAEVRLPAIFGDNMVLQRGMHVPIFGWAEIGETVAVQFMGSTYKATTGADGKWKVKLGIYKAGGPYEMRIAGKSVTLTLKNILIGDVWLASGQSNMEFGIQTEAHAASSIPTATDSQIHFFYVPMALSLQPQQDIATWPAGSPNGKWVVCSPELLANPQWAWHGFSAIGVYFAQQIRKSTGVPIGMIGSYKGGTPVQAWISLEGLQGNPPFTKYIDIYQNLAANYENAKATYPQRLILYRDSLKAWNEEVGKGYDESIKKWNADIALAQANRQPFPVRPKPARPVPVAPLEPEGGYVTPTVCFNGAIAPVVGYGIKGVIWYQGESNGDRLDNAIEYKDLFPRMISDWRAKWQQGPFPFLYVQLPNFNVPACTASEGNWPWVREGQQKALAVAQTGMAVITDAGLPYNIHPPDKVDAANRLVLVARHLVYGENVVSSGPVYKTMRVEGNKVILSFDEVNNGLVAGRPGTANNLSDGETELKGFGIAGGDQRFYWAKATIAGNTIILSADQVPNPIAVRYNWADNPPGNLYNKDGLPARPFRTDDWPPQMQARRY